MISEKHIKQFALVYLLCFLITFSWFWFNGLLLSTIDPVFFLNRLDVTRNVLMLGNMQHYLMNNNWLRICFDVIYLTLPIVLTIAVVTNSRAKSFIAFCTSFFAIIYALFFSSISYISIEGYIGWILIPLVLSAATLKDFYFYLHAVRIIFILIFVSAGIAKIRSGAIVNADQMAAILLKQHSVYLVSNANDWFTKCINYLVQHKLTAQVFYVLGTIAELVFAVGLFTRRFDRILITLFCLFLAMDFFLMRINYFTWMVFMSCFYFSIFQLQDKR